MNSFSKMPRLAALTLAVLAAAQAAHAVADPRRVVCARACTIQVQDAKGYIDIKVPSASGNLKTLYKAGDRFDLEAGKEYVLFLNESMEGWFSFNLRFTPKDSGAAWSCRVRTVPEPPFLAVDQAAWAGAEGKVAVDFDRTRTFLKLDWPAPANPAPAPADPAAAPAPSAAAPAGPAA